MKTFFPKGLFSIKFPYFSEFENFLILQKKTPQLKQKNILLSFFTFFTANSTRLLVLRKFKFLFKNLSFFQIKLGFLTFGKILLLLSLSAATVLYIADSKVSKKKLLGSLMFWPLHFKSTNRLTGCPAFFFSYGWKTTFNASVKFFQVCQVKNVRLSQAFSQKQPVLTISQSNSSNVVWMLKLTFGHITTPAVVSVTNAIGNVLENNLQKSSRVCFTSLRFSRFVECGCA